MHPRAVAYMGANAASLVLAILVAYFFLLQEYPAAWLCTLLAVVANETRVQARGRISRTTLFRIHLSASIPFFLLLSALAFYTHLPLLVALTALIGIVAFTTGGVLWYRGVQHFFQEQPPSSA